MAAFLGLTFRRCPGNKERNHAPTGLTFALLFALASAAVANTYTVTTTADSGAGSLRQAILDANANAGADTIAFNIAGAASTRLPGVGAPPLTSPVTIDGYTQSGRVAEHAAVRPGPERDGPIGSSAGGRGRGQSELTRSRAATTIKRPRRQRLPSASDRHRDGRETDRSSKGNFLAADPDGGSAAGRGRARSAISGARQGVGVGGTRRGPHVIAVTALRTSTSTRFRRPTTEPSSRATSSA